MTDPSEELLATIATTDSGIALIYQLARRARRAVLARRRRGGARRAPDRPPDLLRRAPAAQPATTTSCSSRRPASTPSPRSSTTTSTARSCSRCACSRCASTSCATTPGTTRSPASTTGAASIRLLEMAIARGNRYGWQFTLVVLDLDHLKTDQRHRGPPRPATPRSASSATGSAGCCESATTRPASAATSSR